MNTNDQQLFKLFVYGTLMPGESNYRLIERYVRSARAGCIEGVLVDLGAFPALIAGDGIARGVVLELDDKAMAITDRLEGVHPDQNRSLYLRKEVSVQLDDGQKMQEWTYEYANPSTIGDRPQLVIGRLEGLCRHSWRGKPL